MVYTFFAIVCEFPARDTTGAKLVKHKTTRGLARMAMFGLAATGIATPILAQTRNAVTLRSDVMVERLQRDAVGRARVQLVPPTRLNTGDQLVFIVNYRNTGAHAASGFVITNPLPGSVSYLGSSDPQAVVSVDGGRSWGQLSQLHATQRDGSVRRAQARDVTHVRWAFAQPIASGQSGRLIYRGVVR
jgi:uncharacterized repeat protein (TIGR01451 family)